MTDNQPSVQDALVEKLKGQLEEAERNPLIDYLSIRRSAPLLLPIIGEIIDDNEGGIFLTNLCRIINPAYIRVSPQIGTLSEIIDEEGKDYNVKKINFKKAVQRMYPGDRYHFLANTGISSAAIIYREFKDLRRYIKSHETSVDTKTVVEVNLSFDF